MSDDTVTPETKPSPSDSLSAMLSSLLHDAEILLIQELTLFRAEIVEQCLYLFRGVVSVLAGVAVMLAGGLAIVAAAILALGTIMPYWTASLVVGLGIAAIGAVLILVGRHQLRKADFVPRRTWQSLRESGDWLRDELL